jgi:hypothetical protein
MSQNAQSDTGTRGALQPDERSAELPAIPDHQRRDPVVVRRSGLLPRTVLGRFDVSRKDGGSNDVS